MTLRTCLILSRRHKTCIVLLWLTSDNFTRQRKNSNQEKKRKNKQRKIRKDNEAKALLILRKERFLIKLLVFILLSTESDIVKRDTPLSSREMYRLSRLIVDWDSLAGLMDIPLTTKEGIRNSAVYPDTKSRAEKVLSLFNNSKAFCREKLAGYLKEIGHHDLTTTVTKGSYRCL